MSRFLAVRSDFNTAGNLDTTAPSTPGSLVASAVADTTATVSWAASTDNVAVTGYNVYFVINGNNPTLQGTTGAGTLTFNLTGLVDGAANTIQVTAFDARNNESDPGSIVITTTSTPDTTAPSVPTNLVPGIITNNSIALSWDNSTDSQSGVDHYQVLVGGVLFGTVIDPVATIGGRAASTAYTVTVKAVDVAGNVSAASTGLVETTLAGTGTNVSVRDVAYAQTTAGANVVLTLPSTLIGGDQLIVLVGTGGTTEAQTAPAGWVRPVAPVANATSCLSSIWTRTAAGTLGAASTDRGATVTLTITAGSQKNNLTLLALFGQATSSPLTIATPTTDATSVTAHTLPSLTTTVAGSAVIGLVECRDGTTANTGYTPPTGWTSPTGFNTTGGTNPLNSYITVDPNPEPIGTYAANTVTSAVAENHTVKWQIGVAPNSGPADTTNPSQVTGLAAGSTTSTSIGLSWDAATDNSGTIAQYNVYWDAGTGGTASTFLRAIIPAALSTTVLSLTPATTYAFAVSAVDPSGNEGAKSGTIRPMTAGSSGGSTGIFYGLLVTTDAANNKRLGDRNAANGWVTSGGGVLVDASGNGIHMGTTRTYYTDGTFPAAFAVSHQTGGFGTLTSKNTQICWKGNPGTPNFQNFATAAAGGIDVAYCTFINSIPAGWTVEMTYHHEPNNDWGAKYGQPADYKAAQMRLGALLEGRAMPAGQPAKAGGAPAVNLKAGVTVFNSMCFTLPPAAGQDDWSEVSAALPHANQMDAGAKLCLDAYQNPPPPINDPLPSGGVNALYPTPASLWNFFFSNIFDQFGYSAPGHGYTIGEWMAPARDNDDANHSGQTHAIDTYLTFHENQPIPPYAIRMWEDPNSINDAGAKYIQRAFNGARAIFTQHALSAHAATF